MKTVTLYHSIVCPRCGISKVILSNVIKDFPDIAIKKVEYFSNIQRAKDDGVNMIPTLAYADKKLSGIIFTPGKLRQFLKSL